MVLIWVSFQWEIYLIDGNDYNSYLFFSNFRSHPPSGHGGRLQGRPGVARQPQGADHAV